MSEAASAERVVSDGGRSLRDAVSFALGASTGPQRRGLWLITSVLVLVGLLDVIGVVTLGAASAWLLASSSGQEASALPFQIPGFDPDSPGFDVYRSALVLLAIGIAVLLLRTVLSIMGTRALVRRAFVINDDYAARLWQRLLASPRAMSEVKNSNHVAYALNYGAMGATANILIAAVLLAADAVLIAVLAITVLILSPLAGAIAAAVFGLAGLLFVKVLSPRTQAAGAAVGDNNVEVDTTTRDGIHSYRQAAAIGALGWSRDRLQVSRSRQLQNQSKLQFYLLLPRYAAEIVLVVSLAAVGGAIMVVAQGPQAAALLVAYAAAASRIMPALIRIQSSIVQIRMGSGQALLTYRFVEDLDAAEASDAEAARLAARVDKPGVESTEATAALQASNVSFGYESGDWGLRSVTLSVAPGQMVALVGPSGAGKTTLANIILGLLPPSSGRVLVLGGSPGPEVFARGEVAYVPQDAWVIHASVRDNVAMGRSFSDESIAQALELVGLLDTVRALPGGLDASLDEQGGNLSGGQRQRLGLARALVGNPSLIILDEATSALDARSEESIGDVIAALHGTCAVLVIAHRLRTVVEADQVVYLDQGSIVAQGTFDELREQLPDFAAQARLSGVPA